MLYCEYCSLSFGVVSSVNSVNCKHVCTKKESNESSTRRFLMKKAFLEKKILLRHLTIDVL